jgi:lysophospholipase L1-like esterase
VIAAVAVPLVGVAVLAAEVPLARTGPDLPDDSPLDHDGRVGGAGDALRVVWLGDSTAAGVGASRADLAIPRRVAALLDRPVDVVSLAVSGATISDVVAEQLPFLPDARPDVVAVSIGANDVTHLTPKSAFASAYADLVAAVPDGALLVVLGVPDMGAPPRLAQPLRAVAGLRGRQLDEVARSVVADNRAVYVDIAGETGPTMRSDTGRYFAADRYHPNDDGYALWADAVAEALAPALEGRELAHADR